MRSPVEITKGSAASIAKWRMKEIIEEDAKLPPSKRMPMLKKFAMEQAVVDGGGVDEIAVILYALGIKLSIDKNNPEHKSWIDGHSVILEKE